MCRDTHIWISISRSVVKSQNIQDTGRDWAEPSHSIFEQGYELCSFSQFGGNQDFDVIVLVINQLFKSLGDNVLERDTARHQLLIAIKCT